ncbi:MAG: ATP-grasp domain-containing protein [Hyphomicrobiaceae bacterium]
MVAIESASRQGQIEGRIGTAALTRAASQGLDLTTVVDALGAAVLSGPAKAAALMDLSAIEQLNGRLQEGLALQARALEQCQIYETVTEAATDLHLLVLAAPIHLGGNTPTDFLTEGSSIRHTTMYLGPDLARPDPLPEHDIAFVAAPGDTDSSRPFLLHIADCVRDWPRPVLNTPGAIMGLERDQLPMTLRDTPRLWIPNTARIDREDLAKIGYGALRPDDLFADLDFPLVLRPVGSHAGRNLELLSGAADVQGYLSSCVDPEFFVSPYIDYRSADGAFRKYRIVFVDGKPYACHMAIADQWKVWYMNAGMDRVAEKRREEQRFMERFDDEFGHRHCDTLRELARKVDLDYFGIDCAESLDGRLVVFEADNALIVHDMDSDLVFPYKRNQMQKVFAAFVGMLRARAADRPGTR